MSSLPAFTPGGATATLAVTTASANVALNRSGANQLLVLNLGDAEAFVDFGDSAKTAATTDTPVPAGGWIMLSIPPDATHAAAITASGTATLRLTPGDGEFQGALGGGGSGTSGNPAEVNLVQTGGNTLVVDDAAAGTTAPVPVGGIYNTTKPTYTNGDRTQMQSDSRGGTFAVIKAEDGTTTAPVSTFVTDAQSNTTSLSVKNFGAVFNSSSWDRQRGNTTGTIIIPPQGWSYAAASGGIVNTTTAVTIKGAAGASVRNYLTGLTIAADTLGAATEIAIRDGAGGTVLWRSRLQTTAMNPTNIQFPTPLFSTANTLLEVVTLTAVTGGVYVDATGYTAP